MILFLWSMTWLFSSLINNSRIPISIVYIGTRFSRYLIYWRLDALRSSSCRRFTDICYGWGFDKLTHRLAIDFLFLVRLARFVVLRWGMTSNGYYWLILRSILNGSFTSLVIRYDRGRFCDSTVKLWCIKFLWLSYKALLI